MKEYCVDLELAKELKENGFPQETYFYWCPGRHEIGYEGENNIWDEDTWSFVDFNPNEDYISWYATDNDLKSDEYWEKSKEREKYLKDISSSAPTSDEILKELQRDFIEIAVYSDVYEVKYMRYPHFRVSCKKLSNALAETWLYLKKEGYIK